MHKLKIGIIGTAAVAILVFIGAHFRARMREKDEALAQQTDRIAQLEAENERLSNRLVKVESSVPQAKEPSRELLRLRGQVGVLRQQTNELGELRKENIRLSEAVAESETNQVSAEDQLIVRKNHAVDAMTTLLQAIKNYAANHNGQYPADLYQLVASGAVGATNFPGNIRLNDFQFGPAAGTDPQGQPAVLRVEIPNPKPRGGSVMIVGGIGADGVPHTTLWNVSPGQ